jgi:Xaa-Pro aminopeptidase
VPDGREILANVPRLHDYMDRAQLAAVVVRSGINFTYLSGIAYPGTLARHLDLAPSIRSMLLLWPRGGDPVIVCDPSAAAVTGRDAWVERVELYEAYTESVYRRLAAVIRAAGLQRERIGFEADAISAAHWAELREALPDIQMVDCAHLLEQVRTVKTAGEIRLLREGADLLDDAYLEVFPTIQSGDSEREVHSRIIASCIRRGADWAHGILNSSANAVLYGGEGDTRFRAGDIVRTDYVAYVRGYPGHQSRMAVLGPPTAEQERQYRLTRDIHHMTIDRCRAGVLASDIYNFVVAEYARHGVRYTASLVGHGVGAWFHQQEPILSRARKVPLEESMVLAVEPYRDYWHIQDMVVVRRAGPELLSSKFPTRELFVTG